MEETRARIMGNSNSIGTLVPMLLRGNATRDAEAPNDLTRERHRRRSHAGAWERCQLNLVTVRAEFVEAPEQDHG